MNPLLFYEYGLSKPVGLPFISTWKTDNVSTGSSNASQIKLPLISSGTYSFNVDWGDGMSNSITSYDQVEIMHTYATSGTYTITITGTCKGWKFNNTGDKLKILTISKWGTLKLGKNEGGYFNGCANLTLSSVEDILDLSETTSLSNAFSSCTILSTINRANEWNVSTVTDMSSLFYSAKAFNQDISNWDTSSVTNMSGMFLLAFVFNQPIGNWNTSKVTNMIEMFHTNGEFNQPIGNWNTSNVTNMSGMFGSSYVNFTKFNQDIGSWDTSNVTDMSRMFYQAFSFNSPIGNWNTSKVTTMYSMFENANVFNQAIGNWDTSKVTNMRFMFYSAYAFNKPIGTWNTSSITNMSYMFTNAKVFNQPIGTWDTSKVTDMTAMFSQASAFNQPIGDWNTGALTNIYQMFSNSRTFNQPIGNWDTSKITNMARVFSSNSNFNQNIGSWNISNVTNFSDFMYGKDTTTLSSTNLDAIYNGWSSRPVKPSISITFGAAKYTSASAAARAILTGTPNTWRIIDGGIVA
ncbi:hypothetical protein FLACOL7796_02548 [Flavobacterium collinsii]|uniref:PKD domain-containing protein n=2 Tax=Flavobacterium collinsii TaxID=1114861 RepID=A0ABM8KJF8_9FLAO|nr:hypothetical protein FLACOL7796_02548 [Flavobacterium collinsii]